LFEIKVSVLLNFGSFLAALPFVIFVYFGTVFSFYTEALYSYKVGLDYIVLFCLISEEKSCTDYPELFCFIGNANAFIQDVLGKLLGSGVLFGKRV